MSVTVIIPVRNMAREIGRALLSVSEQTYKGALDIVVADDGSTDHLDAVLFQYRSFIDSVPVRVIKNPTGSLWGICGGRNEAFAISSGQFILPLDADDSIKPTYIEKTIALMQDPEVGIVSTWMRYSEYGEKAGVITETKPQNYWSELQANNITVTSLVRREALVQAGPWDHNLRGWEDWDMWLRILKLGWKHAVVPETLFHYRLHNGGMNAWANQPENKQRLYGYLYQKHPGFGELRKNGETFNGI